MIRILTLLVALTLPAVSQEVIKSPPAGTYVFQQDGTVRPIPDPTALTTAAQEKSIAALRELLDARLIGLEKQMKDIESNLAFNEARSVKRLDEVPSVIGAQVANLAALMNEKFKGVDQQFQGRDTALAAALLAQKTSVDEQNKANAASAAKQDSAVTKQIDGIQSFIMANGKNTDDKIDGVKLLVATQAKGLDDKITDLRAAINDVRSLSSAISSRGAGQSDLIGYIVGGLGLLFAFITVMVLMLRGSSAGAPPQVLYSAPLPGPK
jgi:hypothetical protein